MSGERERQRTLGGPAVVEGRALFHAGHVTARLTPADAETGLVFRRVDMPNALPIPAHVDFAEGRDRRTALRRGEASVDLVEHCLAAFSGMGIDNCVVDIDGPEPPAGDGSALAFCEAIERVGVREQDAPLRPLTIAQPVSVLDGDASIVATPPGETGAFEVLYRLDFGGCSAVPSGVCAASIDACTFAETVAPARTFTTDTEARAMREAGYFEHVSPSDVLVFGESGPIGNTLRFDDEPARHKLLDLVGDLALVGKPIRGRVVAQRSGHAVNRELARKLVEMERGTSSGSAMGVRRIYDVLPHRYPMLLVDRVLENRAGERAVGIKNVTFNEPFFQGHYPDNPIMPGVLLIESMGQLAGLMLADRLDSEEKLALLLALDGVKLRKAVIPGDQLLLHAETLRYRERYAEVQCHALIDGEAAAEARVKFMLVEKAFDPRSGA